MSNLLEAIGRLPDQITRAWADMKAVELSASFKSATNIVVMGMGGSALGAHVVKTALQSRNTVPVEIIGDYTLPATATKSSLVICSSFSGTTEEVLSAYKAARAKKLNIFVVCTGGELAKLAKRDGTPSYIFDAADLAPQPRYGSGFMSFSILGVLNRLGFVKVTDKEVTALAKHLQTVCKSAARDGKKFAKALVGRVPLLVASEHLEGAAHVFANQTNESSKHFATSFLLPELNHHLMEGLTFPKEVINKISFIFLESKLYHPRIQQRYPLTQTVVKKNGAQVLRIAPTGKTALEQAFEIIQLGAYVTYEMAMLANVNPENIPWVDWFKSKMA